MDLVQVAEALSAVTGFAGALEGGEEDRDQKRDDANDDKQFDECEAALRIGPRSSADVGHCDTPKCEVQEAEEEAPANRGDMGDTLTAANERSGQSIFLVYKPFLRRAIRFFVDS
jgi:hypothetical protein